LKITQVCTFILLSIISSVINRPAILAVSNDTKHPQINARKATFVMDGLLSGLSALKIPIKTPIEAGLANPQIANVAIAADLGFDESKCNNLRVLIKTVD
jgi:hypothetical protein